MSNNFASRLIQARKARGWSPEELAQRAGIEVDLLAHLESGRVRIGRKYPRLASALGISLEWLATGRQEAIPFLPPKASSGSADRDAVGERPNPVNGFALRLIEARTKRPDPKELPWSQEKLASLLNMSQGAIGHLESGRTRPPKDVSKFATVLGVNPLWLATGEGSKELLPDESKKRLFEAIEALPLLPGQIEQLASIFEALGKPKEESRPKAARSRKAIEYTFPPDERPKNEKNAPSIKKAS